MSLLDLDAAYTRLFNKPVDEEGRKYWTDQYTREKETLGAKQANENVLRDLRSSAEFKPIAESWVTDAYDTHFGKVGDEAGHEYWTNALIEGHQGKRDPVDWLNASFLNSPESINLISGDGGVGAGAGGYGGSTEEVIEDTTTTTPGTGYEQFSGELSSLRSDMEKWQTDMESSMNNMWSNYSWGDPRTVGGVRTQNELPGWAPKKGGTSGFFGRGGNRFGLSSSSLNI